MAHLYAAPTTETFYIETVLQNKCLDSLLQLKSQA